MPDDDTRTAPYIPRLQYVYIAHQCTSGAGGASDIMPIRKEYGSLNAKCTVLVQPSVMYTPLLEWAHAFKQGWPLMIFNFGKLLQSTQSAALKAQL